MEVGQLMGKSWKESLNVIQRQTLLMDTVGQSHEFISCPSKETHSDDRKGNTRVQYTRKCRHFSGREIWGRLGKTESSWRGGRGRAGPVCPKSGQRGGRRERACLSLRPCQFPKVLGPLEGGPKSQRLITGLEEVARGPRLLPSSPEGGWRLFCGAWSQISSGPEGRRPGRAKRGRTRSRRCRLHVEGGAPAFLLNFFALRASEDKHITTALSQAKVACHHCCLRLWAWRGHGLGLDL